MIYKPSPWIDFEIGGLFLFKLDIIKNQHN